MCNKYATLCVFILKIIIVEHVSGSFIQSFGPYNVSLEGITTCKGPRRRNCTVYTAKKLNDTIISLDVDVLEDIHEIEGKIEIGLTKKSSWKLPMKKICGHVFWQPFFEKIASLNKNCILPKGKYHASINIEELALKYNGGTFLYGKLITRSAFYNKDCNFSCANVELSFSPK